MPRAAIDDSDRMNLRIKPEVKARLMRAAEAVIAEADVRKASERDFMRILELLDNPPKPNANLLAAAKALPKTL